MSEFKKSKFDIEFPFDSVNGLVDNKYKNRRFVRESLNTIAESSFKRSRAAGWTPHIRADMHVVDRLSDREFPISEFFQIVGKVASRYEKDILKIVNKRFDPAEPDNREESLQVIVPGRINCYGHGAWMVGVTISIHYNRGTGARSYHLEIRTCYAERNMVHRKRDIDVEKIWTRGVPKWVKNPEPYRDPYAIDEVEEVSNDE